MAAPLTLSFPSTISSPRYICYGLEFIFWILYFISCTVFLKLLKQTRSVHRNLRIILANMCIDYFVVGVTRFFILFNHINFEQGLNPHLLYGITLLAFIGLTAKTASEFMLLIERFVSTIFASKYEKMRSLHISVIFGSFCYIYPCITLPLLVNNVVTKKIFIPIPIIFDICSWIFTILLLKINSNTYVYDYNRKNISNNKFSLTKRYQTVENIRTLRAIVWFLIYSTVSNAITVSFHAFNTTYFNELSDKEAYALCEALWYMINSIVATLLPIPFILKHDDFKKHFMAMIGKNKDYEYSHPYRTVTGGSINMNNDADTHFNNLKSLWMEPGFDFSNHQKYRLLSRTSTTQIQPSSGWMK